MKTRTIVFLVLAGCSSDATSHTPSTPNPTPTVTANPSIGLVSAADSTLDSGVVPIGGHVLPSIDAGNLAVVWVPNDAGMACTAPFIEGCPQVPPQDFYYYSPNPSASTTMYDEQGTPISKPLGGGCPTANTYEVHCGIDFDAASGWGGPPDKSLGCSQNGGYSGIYYCCPCP